MKVLAVLMVKYFYSKETRWSRIETNLPGAILNSAVARYVSFGIEPTL